MKISMTCTEDEVEIKMVHGQWLQLQINISWVVT